MTTLIPYLFFGGRCEEALAFYSEALNGRARSMQRFGDMAEGPRKEWIVHSEFEASGIAFMASDGVHEGLPPGGQIFLALGFDAREEQERIFAALSRGGRVERPLHDTFYGGRMGVLTDRFGIGWMLNCS